ncbi:MAG: hypothetical protein B6U69_02445 [Thermofilum sp. ex4484_15]|nr:MAG: hypothetical protein B6U69_02445 [Thermofilum sp. ex4484_15]
MDPWELRKRQFLSKLEGDLKKGKLDEDILGVLNLINSLKCYYTTSSCSGRIELTVAKWPGDKFGMKVVGKWHREVEVREVEKYLNDAYEDLWLLVQPPIIHVVSSGLIQADRLIKLARASGFKHSGIQSLREDRIVLEIMGSERMEVPLIVGGRLLVNESRLKELVEVANFILRKGKEKLRKLSSSLREYGGRLCD